MVKNLVNDFSRGTIMSAIALHDFSKEECDHKKWIQYCIGIMNQYGLTPTRMGITAPSLKSNQMKTFKREIKNLDKIDPNSITSISLQATIHASDDSWKDYLFHCDFSINSVNKRCSFVVVIDNHVHLLLKNEVNTIIQNLCKYFEPKYGYYYQRERKKGPHCYVGGIIMGVERENPESINISSWNKNYCISDKYQTGCIRDIFPMNLIVNEHLSREVLPNTTLQQFIQSDTRHGILDTLGDDRYAWWIDNESIPLVREALRPSGIIIAG